MQITKKIYYFIRKNSITLTISHKPLHKINRRKMNKFLSTWKIRKGLIREKKFKHYGEFIVQIQA